MSGAETRRDWVPGTVLVVMLVLVAGGIAIRGIHPPPPAPAAAPAPAAPAPAAAAAVPAPDIEQCLVPGPAPAMPRGSVASAEDMTIQHNAVQGFVDALEGYQACVNAVIDHAPPGTDERTKQSWVTLSNRAIDRAEALAAAYDEQVRIFKARQSETPPER